jgi:site-specific recombinase XerD
MLAGYAVSEARDLKTSDIDRAGMQLRVRNGKGAKERALRLSTRLFKELGDFWRVQRQGKAGHDSPWLFLGETAGEPMGISSAQTIYYRAVKKERRAVSFGDGAVRN